MVQYLQFDSRLGTIEPFDYATSNVPPVCLLRVQDVVLVDCDSATSQDVFVYYDIQGADMGVNGQKFTQWPYTKVTFASPQVDYECANWLRDEIQKALEMTDGPSILTVTSIPPILITQVAAW
jgi:hypothetical protein